MTGLRDIELYGAPVRLDVGAVEKRVGLIALATDHTSEPDFARMVASERLGVYVARIPYANPTTRENLAKIGPRLAEAAALILPGEALDAVCFSCSSASAVIGDGEVAAAVRGAKSGVPVVTPTLAAVLGLRALGAKGISVLTPYTAETSRPMAAYFRAAGFVIDRFTCLGLDDDREMARIAPGQLADLAREVTAPESDALFVSCTALRAAAVVPAIEHAIGRPAVTSNQASAWACLRLCGDHAERPRFGRLMTLTLPPEGLG